MYDYSRKLEPQRKQKKKRRTRASKRLRDGQAREGKKKPISSMNFERESCKTFRDLTTKEEKKKKSEEIQKNNNNNRSIVQASSLLR